MAAQIPIQKLVNPNRVRVAVMLCLAFMLVACTSSNQQFSLEERVKVYFSVFAQRQDFSALMSFYHPDAQLQDLIYGNHIVGKDAIRGFYRWDDTAVKLQQKYALVVQEQVLQGNRAVTSG